MRHLPVAFAEFVVRDAVKQLDAGALIADGDHQRGVLGRGVEADEGTGS